MSVIWQEMELEESVSVLFVNHIFRIDSIVVWNRFLIGQMECVFFHRCASGLP